ncbi:MAG TPA: DUF4157 domain-containing protein [Pyrinomonadaceae bacterium]|nr:DUF4157 domain-containing protein [Pyrinomonadaceae bacterium]
MKFTFGQKSRNRSGAADSISAATATPKNNSRFVPGIPLFLKPVAAQAKTSVKDSAWATPGIKIKVVDDRHSSEREADRLAEDSLSQPDSDADRERRQSLSPAKGNPVAPKSSSVIRGPGEPLPETERRHFESSMGVDFSNVRVHRDSEAAGQAADLNSLAVTENQDIAFAAGKYQPSSGEGRRLLGHELAHVKQQASGSVTGLQRQPLPPAAQPQTEPQGQQAQPAGPQTETERPTDEFFARDEVELIRGRAFTRYYQVSGTVGIGARVIENIKSNLLDASTRYHSAYDGYATAIRAAGQEARSQQQWFDFFMGIAIGVSAGVLSEWLFVAEGASLALEMTVEVGAEVAEGVTGAGLRASGLTEFVGQDLAPSRDLDPMVFDLEIYRLLESLHRKILSFAGYADAQFLINGAAEYAIGEIRVHVAGGQEEMSESDLLDLISALMRADSSSADLDRTMPALRSRLQDIETRVLSAPVQTTQEMEQDIWILWMSTILNRDSNILDYDAIEDHLASIGVLGPNSRLGVDFGWWTSEDDELAALEAARDQATRIRHRNSELTRPEE